MYAWDDEGNEKFRMGGPDSRDGRLVPDSHEDMVLDLLYIESLETLASASMDHKVSHDVTMTSL